MGQWYLLPQPYLTQKSGIRHLCAYSPQIFITSLHSVLLCGKFMPFALPCLALLPPKKKILSLSFFNSLTGLRPGFFCKLGSCDIPPANHHVKEICWPYHGPRLSTYCLYSRQELTGGNTYWQCIRHQRDSSSMSISFIGT